MWELLIWKIRWYRSRHKQWSWACWISIRSCTFPTMLYVTRSQSSLSDYHLGLIWRHKEGEAREFLSPSSWPRRHLCVNFCQRNLSKLYLPPCNPAPWALVTLLLLCVIPLLVLFPSSVISRLLQCFLFDFQLSYNLWHQFHELNSLQWSCFWLVPDW